MTSPMQESDPTPVTEHQSQEHGAEFSVDMLESDEESAQETEGPTEGESDDSSESDDDSAPDKEYEAAREMTVKKFNEKTACLLDELRDTMYTSHKDFIFSCGGSIPILMDKDDGVRRRSSTPDVATVQTALSYQPVTLRWDPCDPSALKSLHRKLTFPLDIDNGSQVTIENLIADMSPASFGLGGQDVYDESYRKALKLDPSRFSTNFSPYEAGIIDAIAQMLLPSHGGDNQRGVRAELYKLNVYEGPSGHFRAHLDTPRSASQFGSLVVCLPAPHEGGQLEVRHNAEKMTFDWSGTGKDDQNIEWAAFYSDCEHEVFQVRSGHRVTLTYNLYATHGNGQLGRDCNTIDWARLPLYKQMNGILDQEEFMPKGGWLGFYTTHAYPHTSNQFVIDTLKGIDMAIWQGFQALGCGVCLRPILEYPTSENEFGNLVGKFFPMVCTDGMAETYQGIKEVASEVWGQESLDYSHIQWLNDAGNKEFQLAYTAYGNEAHATALYSRCAIIVRVPPYGETGRMALINTFKEREKDWE